MADKATVETKDAPGAVPQDGEALTIDIPQDFQFDDVPDPNAAAAPAAEPVKTEPAKEAPKAEPVKPDGKVVPIGALHEERARRREAEKQGAYWRRVVADRDKLRTAPAVEPKREAERKPPAPRPDPVSRLRDAFGRTAGELDKVLPELRPVQEKFVEAVAQVLDEHGKWVEGRAAEIEAAQGNLTKTVDAVNGWIEDQRLLNRAKIKRQEGEIRRKHTDWEETVKKAGIFEAVAQDRDGRYGDPMIALQVYSSENPPDEAYRLAKSKLAYETVELGEEVEEEELPTLTGEVPKGAAPKAEGSPKAEPTPAPAKGEGPEAEAERRGRAEVATAVAANAEKPRGIRGLRSAGPGRGELRLNEDTRRFMDHLMEVDYDRYMRLVGANGGKEGRLYRWHHGGF